MTDPSSAPSSSGNHDVYDTLQDIIGTDAGDRGMKPLIVPGDLKAGAKALGHISVPSTVVVLSGFPCCVNESPPSETDGPPGTFAIARAAAAMGHHVIVVTDSSSRVVFQAAWNGLVLPPKSGKVTLQADFPSTFSDSDERRFVELCQQCDLLISCERAGPGKDGICYTMRGIDMNAKGIIAPLHRLVKESQSTTTFVAIGDGGNELGMGKVIDKIRSNAKIPNGDKIGCVIAADHLIAASVSNWGGYALAAGAALAHAETKESTTTEWVERCLPSREDEIALLNRCVEAGCRDGVSGKMEATVDGMPLERSLQCLDDIRAAATVNSR